MAPAHDWIDDKVDKIQNAKIALGEKPYYDLTPQRNPNDPVDQAVRAIPQKWEAMNAGPSPTQGINFNQGNLAAAHPQPAPATFFNGPRSAIAFNPNFAGPGPAGTTRGRAIETDYLAGNHTPFAPVTAAIQPTPAAPPPTEAFRPDPALNMVQDERGGGAGRSGIMAGSPFLGNGRGGENDITDAHIGLK